jgi:four helix bundle protein
MKSTINEPGRERSSFQYSFEKLESWHLSRKFVSQIYRTTHSFPVSERYGITSQLQRAAISISSNLAEGSGRKSAKDQAHFTQMSYSSLMEVINLLFIALDLGYVQETDFNMIRSDAFEISNKLNALYNYQKNKSTH